MRSFVTAILILSAICIMIGINSCYVTSRTDELLSICEALENDSSPLKIDALLSKWESCRSIIALSIQRNDLEIAENAILGLIEYQNRPDDFKYYLSVLTVAIYRIADEQKFSADSIF